MDDDVVTPAVAGEPVADERAFPSPLPAPGTGGRSELGEPVQLYSSDARPFPTPADVPASAPPVIASGPGDLVGWLLRGRRGGRVSGEGGTVNDLSAGHVAARLRVLLDAIEAGEIEADLDHTAYLRGAADALAMVADPAADQR